MSEPVKYPWYRLSVVTCVAIAITTWALTCAHNEEQGLLREGWPLRPYLHADLPVVIFVYIADYCVAMLLVIGVGVFTERLMRSRNFRFSIRTLLLSIFVISVVIFCWVTEPLTMWARDILAAFEISPTLLWRQVSPIPTIVISIAIGCTLFVAASSILRLFGRVLRHEDR